MPTSTHDSGFTLIEILVVLMILGLSANLIMTRFNPGQTETGLSDGAARMILARVAAQSGYAEVSVPAAPWGTGEVRFLPEGFSDARSFAFREKRMDVLPWGGLRLVP